MEEMQIMDASAIDNLNDYELTGEEEEEGYLSEPASQTPETEESLDANESESAPSQPSDSSETENDNEGNDEGDDDDFTREVLRLKGINDPNKIKFEDESGAIIERSWDDLTTNEKLSILTLEEDTDRDLDDEEAAFINMLRSNNLTPTSYIKLLQNNIEQHMQSVQPVSYEVDSLSDDELFALDLIEKIGEDNVTDEELQQALEQAKTSPELYQKQVAALRTRYKTLEDQRKYEEDQQLQAQLEQYYRDFSEQILSLIEGFESIAGQEIELSVDDKNDIANYILTRDETGQSDFYKDLQNPQALTAAAFWVLKGPEIMQELQGQIQEAYKRGYELGSARNSKKAPMPAPAPKVVIAKEPSERPSFRNNDASAAFGDDESYLYN